MIRYETTVWRETTLEAATSIATFRATQAIDDWDTMDVVVHDEYEHTYMGVVEVGRVFEFTFFVNDRG